VHAPGPVVAERTWSGGTQTTTYHHRDDLGSLRVATDAAGALADAHECCPFGGEKGPAFVSAAASTPASARVDVQHAAAAAQAVIAGSTIPMDQGDKVIQEPMR